jgi:hypothetical protein
MFLKQKQINLSGQTKRQDKHELLSKAMTERQERSKVKLQLTAVSRLQVLLKKILMQ